MSTLATGAADVAHKLATTPESLRRTRINSVLYWLEVEVTQLCAEGAPLEDLIAVYDEAARELTGLEADR